MQTNINELSTCLDKLTYFFPRFCFDKMYINVYFSLFTLPPHTQKRELRLTPKSVSKGNTLSAYHGKTERVINTNNKFC